MLKAAKETFYFPMPFSSTTVDRNLFALLASWRLFIFLMLLFSISCTSAVPSLDTITIAIEAGPNNLDPRIGLSSESERIHQLLFNSLVRRGAHFEVLPDLAERWETPDPTTYRFILRSGGCAFMMEKRCPPAMCATHCNRCSTVRHPPGAFCETTVP